jgi:hypothetical protein
MNKYHCYKLILCLVVAIASIWISTSCLKTDLKQIRNIPLQESASKRNYNRIDFGYHFGKQRSFNNAPTEIPTDIRMILLDDKYKPLDFFFWLEFNNWFEELKFQNGIMAMDQKENLDCDNFAMLYKSLASVSAYKSGIQEEVGVGLVAVDQIHPFGGVPAGGLHMLNIVFTSKNWYIYEAQTGQYIQLDKYPNQKYIRYIIL